MVSSLNTHSIFILINCCLSVLSGHSNPVKLYTDFKNTKANCMKCVLAIYCYFSLKYMHFTTKLKVSYRNVPIRSPQALRHYQVCFYSVPFLRHRGAYSVLLTHDNSCKRTPVKQFVVAVIMILSNIFRAWIMYLCIESAKFLLEALGTSIL